MNLSTSNSNISWLLTFLSLRFFILTAGGMGSPSLNFPLGFSGGGELGRPDLAGVAVGAISRRVGGTDLVVEEGERGPWTVGERGVAGMSVDKSFNRGSYFSLSTCWKMTSSSVKPLTGEEGGEGRAGGEAKVGGEAREGEGRAGEGRAGEARAGEGRAGEAREGEARAGEARAGEGRAGEARPGRPGRAGEAKRRPNLHW